MNNLFVKFCFYLDYSPLKYLYSILKKPLTPDLP